MVKVTNKYDENKYKKTSTLIRVVTMFVQKDPVAYSAQLIKDLTSFSIKHNGILAKERPLLCWTTAELLAEVAIRRNRLKQ